MFTAHRPPPQANPGFMLVSCKFSCQKIEWAREAYYRRCPKPPGHKAALEPGVMPGTFARIMNDFKSLEPEMISEDPPVRLCGSAGRVLSSAEFVGGE